MLSSFSLQKSTHLALGLGFTISPELQEGMSGVSEIFLSKDTALGSEEEYTSAVSSRLKENDMCYLLKESQAFFIII